MILENAVAVYVSKKKSFFLLFIAPESLRDGNECAMLLVLFVVGSVSIKIASIGHVLLVLASLLELHYVILERWICFPLKETRF